MSIRVKLVFMYIALVFIVMISAGTFIIYSLGQDQDSLMRFVLEEQARDIYVNVIDAPFRDVGFDFGAAGVEGLEAMFEQSFAELATNRLPQDMEAFIIAVEDGRTIHASVVSPFSNLAYIFASTVISAFAGIANFAAGQQHISDLGHAEPWFEFAMPVFIDYISDGPAYVIYVRQRATAFNESLAQTARIIGLSSLIALGGATLLGIAFSNSITSNILKLNKSIKAFKPGLEMDRLSLDSKDEIAELTDSFNNLATELYKTMREITNEKNKIEIVMQNMTDGILAYDKGGAVVHYNQICEDMLNRPVSNMSLFDMLAAIGLEHTGDFESLQDSIISVMSPDGERYIQVAFNPYSDAAGDIEGLIVVLQDITKHMKLDNMRREFVANVSHEIRTPLTTIKSYAETLMEIISDNELANSFLNVINNEADQMANIVKDLLELSRFDNKQMDLDIKDVDLLKLVESNALSHRMAAGEGKDISFYSNAVDEELIVQIDPTRIEQVLNNIITNAIRYSGEYARIDIEVCQDEGRYIVRISDDGIGIPANELRMVFERFYRVDKARSRELGGSGLGLSIAKEIMEAHGGQIHAESELGKGTTMILYFKSQKI